MTGEDADRWNSRYLAEDLSISHQPSRLLIDHLDLLPRQGLALDLAMGLGHNAGVLLRHGLRVVGVDISWVAVRQAKLNFPGLMCAVVDLERFLIPVNIFDVIINTLYLQRSLWQPIVFGLKIGGIVLIECLTEDMLELHPEIDPSYLLKSGELRQTFTEPGISRNLELLSYSEGWKLSNAQHRRATACLVARRFAQ